MMSAELPATGPEPEQRFEALYESAAPTLYAWARLRLRPPLSHHLEAEDVMQEVWIRAHNNFSGFEGNERGFRGWVLAIAQNFLIEAYRKYQRATTVRPASGWLISTVDHFPESASSMTQRIARGEHLQNLMREIEKLTEDNQRIVLLCGLEGLTQAEAATRLSLSATAVSKRWQRIRTQLARHSVAKQVLF